MRAELEAGVEALDLGSVLEAEVGAGAGRGECGRPRGGN